MQKYTLPQYRLWAKFIQSKRHESYDEPPNIPLITGNPDSRKHARKESLSDVITNAATAFAKVLNTSPKTQDMNTSPKTQGIPKQGISPNTHANLRRKHLEDMRMLHSLFEDGILSSLEYKEQKENILSTLQELSH